MQMGTMMAYIPRTPGLSAALLPVFALTLACAPGKDDTDATGSTGPTGPTEGTDATDPGGSETVEPTGDPVCAGGPMDGELACEAAGDTSVTLAVEGSFFEGPVEAQCVVQSTAEDGDVQTIVLTCADDEARLLLTSSAPHVSATVAVDQMVRLAYTTLQGGEILEFYFALYDMQDALIVAGFSGVLKPDLLPLTMAPLTVDLPSSDCESSLGFEDCTVAQNTALRVTWGEKSTDVHRFNHAKLGSSPDYEIVTGRVARPICAAENAFCNYNTFGLDALIVALP